MITAQNMSEKYLKKTVGSSVRIPPQNIDAEKALLGSILLRPGVIHEMGDMISPESFYVEKHRIIYREMMDLARTNDPIDIVTVTTKLREKNLFDTVGGGSYLAEITALVPSATNLDYYAGIVTKKSILRSLITAGDEIVEHAFNESEDVEHVLDSAEKRIMGITNRGTSAKKFTGIREILPSTWDLLMKLKDNTGELRGVPTGFRDMDKKLNGFQSSDLIILAARPSMGKTSLALDLARHAALDHNIPVGIFSLEMSAQSLVDRMLSAEARVDAWKMRTGTALTEKDMDLLQEASARLSKAPIYIDDTPGATILNMRSVARRLKAEHGLGLILVDYLQLIHTTKNYDSMVNQVTEISRALKGLARELKVPVIALSQLSRAVESRGGEPRLSDLRDSGSIEQDADVVMFIHSEDRFKPREEQTGITKIIIAKHRNGAIGDLELHFDGSKTSFMDIDKNGFDDYTKKVPFNGTHEPTASDDFVDF